MRNKSIDLQVAEINFATFRSPNITKQSSADFFNSLYTASEDVVRFNTFRTFLEAIKSDAENFESSLLSSKNTSCETGDKI